MNLSASQFEPGNLPIGWASATIQNMIGKDGIFSDGDWVETKDQDPNGDVRLIQLADIGDGVYKNKSNRYLTGKKAVELKCTFLKPGDVLIARMPDPLGRACIFPGDSKDSVTAVDVCIIRTGENGVSNRWLMFATNSLPIRASIAGLQSGSTRKRISRKNLGRILYPVPPILEQRRIVAKIEELFTKLDAGVEALKKIKAELKRYRQAVLKHAFEGKLTAEWREKNKDKLEPASKLLERIAKEREKNAKGKAKKLPPLDTSELPELPEGWEWANLSLIIKKVKRGPSMKCNQEGKGIRYITSGNLQNGKVKLDLDYKFLDGFDKIDKCRLLPQDLIFNCVNSLEQIGKSAVWEVRHGDAIVGFNNYALELDLLISPYFANYFFQSGLCKKQLYFLIKRAVNQVSFATRELDFIAFTILCPKEQQKIIEEIERHFSVADQIEQTIVQGLKQSERLRQSILKKAFEGKLVPQDPEDEPAEKLLERIKEEKESYSWSRRP